MMSLSRKASSEESFGPYECHCSLLTTLLPQQLTRGSDVLRRCSSPAEHTEKIINLVYRCHDPQLTQPFAQLMADHHPHLKQPTISTLYPNHCFPHLQAFQLMGEDASTSQALHMPPLPSGFNALLSSLFNAYGYIPNLERFLMFYPNYLERHLLAERQLLEGDKIDQKVAYFLALVGAAEKGSTYMMVRYLKRFLKSGGQLEWLSKGTFPSKLAPLLRLNRKMSHCVWEITSDIIQDILENESFRWSTNELAVIVQIFAFSHHDSTLALALGLVPEEKHLLDELNLHKIAQLKSAYDARLYETSPEELESHFEMLEMVERRESQEEGLKDEEETAQEDTPKKQSHKSEPYMKEIAKELIKKDLYEQINELLQPLLEPFESNERRSERNYPPIDESEYNYKFMAYPILNNLTESVAGRIQALIECAQTMTYGNFGSHSIKQTKEFRKSVRYYGEQLCGYTHQGYNYKSDLSAVLSAPLKFYIRLLMLSPLHINRQVLDGIRHEGGQIECFDLGHIAILVACARMTLELTLTVQAFDI